MQARRSLKGTGQEPDATKYAHLPLTNQRLAQLQVFKVPYLPGALEVARQNEMDWIKRLRARQAAHSARPGVASSPAVASSAVVASSSADTVVATVATAAAAAATAAAPAASAAAAAAAAATTAAVAAAAAPAVAAAAAAAPSADAAAAAAAVLHLPAVGAPAAAAASAVVANSAAAAVASATATFAPAASAPTASASASAASAPAPAPAPAFAVAATASVERSILERTIDLVEAFVPFQPHATRQIAETIVQAQQPINNTDKPLVLTFAGVPSTGKTTAARLLARLLNHEAAVQPSTSHLDDPPHFLQINANGASRATEAVCREIAEFFTQLTDCEGAHATLFIDELGKANNNYLKTLQPLFDEGTVTFRGGTARNPVPVRVRVPRGTPLVIILATNTGEDVLSAQARQHPDEEKRCREVADRCVMQSCGNDRSWRDRAFARVCLFYDYNRQQKRVLLEREMTTAGWIMPSEFHGRVTLSFDPECCSYLLQTWIQGENLRSVKSKLSTGTILALADYRPVYAKGAPPCTLTLTVRSIGVGRDVRFQLRRIGRTGTDEVSRFSRCGQVGER